MIQSPWQLPDSFFNQLGTKNWAIADNALELSAAHFVSEQCLLLSPTFESAGIGRANSKNSILIEKSVRSDKIKWLTPTDGAWPIVENLKELLKSQLRLHLLDFEAHFSKYDPGSSYLMHFDQFQDSKGMQGSQNLVPKRILSFIFYLNHNWNLGDGGELSIFSATETLEIKVEPLFNRLVVFQSALVPHSVSETQKPRYSLTGWMRK